MADKINVLIPEETVDAKIKEIGEQISKDYAGKEVHLICILKGGVFFACELAKRITVPVSLDFMQVSSYGDATESSGIVRIKKDLDDTMENKEVIIVETYRTVRSSFWKISSTPEEHFTTLSLY